MNALLTAIGLSETAENTLYVNSAVEWLSSHTVLDVSNVENLSAAVRLFILKYSQLMAISTGVTSESISGLSQSFETGQSLESKIYELAVALLGFDALKSTVIVNTGEDGWDYER